MYSFAVNSAYPMYNTHTATLHKRRLSEPKQTNISHEKPNRRLSALKPAHLWHLTAIHSCMFSCALCFMFSVYGFVVHPKYSLQFHAGYVLHSSRSLRFSLISTDTSKYSTAHNILRKRVHAACIHINRVLKGTVNGHTINDMSSLLLPLVVVFREKLPLNLGLQANRLPQSFCFCLTYFLAYDFYKIFPWWIIHVHRIALLLLSLTFASCCPLSQNERINRPQILQ